MAMVEASPPLAPALCPPANPFPASGALLLTPSHSLCRRLSKTSQAGLIKHWIRGWCWLRMVSRNAGQAGTPWAAQKDILDKRDRLGNGSHGFPSPQSEALGFGNGGGGGVPDLSLSGFRLPVIWQFCFAPRKVRLRWQGLSSTMQLSSLPW